MCEAEKAARVGLIGGIDTVTGDRLPPLESFQVLLKGAELCAAQELCSLQGLSLRLTLTKLQSLLLENKHEIDITITITPTTLS